MDKKGFLKGSFYIITHFCITYLIILLFFLSVSQLFIRVSQAQDPSQIYLTDSIGQVFSGGILIDNFEIYYDFYPPDPMGWHIYSDPSWCGMAFPQYVMDSVKGSNVLNAKLYFNPHLYFLCEYGYCYGTHALTKKTAYKDLQGNTHDFIPTDFSFLTFEMKITPPIFSVDFFRFEVKVKTDNNGYASVILRPFDMPMGYHGVLSEDEEIISNNEKNPSNILVYIGRKYGDGEWHQVTVDLNEVVKKYSTIDEELTQILSVTVRGNAFQLDDIIFTKRCNAGNKHDPYLLHIGPVYCQLYGQQGDTPQGRWIFAEDLDLGLTSECTAEDGYLFPHIADDADGDGIPTSLHINPDGTIKNQADITESTLAIYPLDPDGKPNLASPQTPADADLTWVLTLGDTLGPQIANEFVEAAEINLDGDTIISGDEMNTWPSHLIQRNGVFLENKVETDPDVVQATGTPYVMDLTNPMYALACALRNSGYGIFPNTKKIEPHLGQVFEDMIVTCRVSDGTATDKETFPVSIVNYPVTNHPPIIDDVEDQVFEVGKTNYYQIVAYDPDLEDMEGLSYTAFLNGKSAFYHYGPWWPPPINLPNGLISFKPFCEGTIDCIVTVRDPRGMIAICEFTIFCKIVDEYPGNWFNHPPVILGELDSPQSIRAGEMFIASEMDFLDPDGDKMYWSCNVGSVGNNGVYTFQSIYPGDYQVQIIAYDIRGGSTSTEFVINVKPWWSL